MRNGFVGAWALQGVGVGGFSPGKLRNMLLGVEKKRKEEEEIDSTFTQRSHNADNDESGLLCRANFWFIWEK